MALIKQPPTDSAPVEPQVQQADIPFDMNDSTPPFETSEAPPPFEMDEPIPPFETREDALPTTINHAQPEIQIGGALQQLESQGYQGLVLDWTSFASISLKNEGIFQDIDGVSYGKEFDCRVITTKERYVYRANPVTDNKRDTAFTYDKVKTQDGRLVSDILADWNARGKTVDEKKYLEALVEMIAPGEPFDGEYRILSISPTSLGRFTGRMIQATALGGGNPSSVIMTVKVGAKITKVANPYYPWAFEVRKP